MFPEAASDCKLEQPVHSFFPGSQGKVWVWDGRRVLLQVQLVPVGEEAYLRQQRAQK